MVWGAQRWLPSNEHWYSGVPLYRYLLPSQLALLAVMVAVSLDLNRGRGLFAAEWWSMPALYLAALSWIYFGPLVVRYVLTMWLRPELRWFKRTNAFRTPAATGLAL